MTIDSPARAVRNRVPSWAVMGLAAVACAAAAAMPAPAAAKAKQKPMLMFATPPATA
jgi:hypothetical protein